MLRKVLFLVAPLLLGASAVRGQAKSYTWGPYAYSIGSARDSSNQFFDKTPGESSDQTPDSTVRISETVHLENGVVTIRTTETRSPDRKGATVAPRLRNYTCTGLSAGIKMKWLNQKLGSADYLPSPLWEVDLTCKEGAVAVVFPAANDAAALARLINDQKIKGEKKR